MAAETVIRGADRKLIIDGDLIPIMSGSFNLGTWANSWETVYCENIQLQGAPYGVGLRERIEKLEREVAELQTMVTTNCFPSAPEVTD